MKIGAVITLYNPELSQVEKLIDFLAEQVDKIVLVDNSDSKIENISLKKAPVQYISMSGNKGIASAQNCAIKYLTKEEYDFVIFLDQDTYCSEKIITTLIDIYICLENQGVKVAALGPHPINSNNGKSGYNRHWGRKIGQMKLTTNEKTYTLDEMHSINSSYSLIQLSKIKDVGYFDESLFIDGVDNEWCWRAKYKKGLRTFCVRNICVVQTYGTPTNLPLKLSSTFRLYYQYRNFIKLAKRNYTPFLWKVRCAITYTIKLFFYPMFISPRWKNLKQILKGIKDGFS